MVHGPWSSLSCENKNKLWRWCSSASSCHLERSGSDPAVVLVVCRTFFKKKKTAGAPFCWFWWEDQHGLGISCVKIASFRVISTKKSVPTHTHTHTSDDHGSPASVAPLRVKAEPAPGPKGSLRGQADPSSALWHRWSLQAEICKTIRPGRGRTRSCCDTKP